MKSLTCFKANDIRGQIGEQLNEQIAYLLGQAMVQYLGAKMIVVGGDNRLSTPSLKEALINGICDQGCNVIDIGRCGTEEIYFATCHYQSDGGVMITASHNPIDYNGMKLVRKKSEPIGNDSGLLTIKSLVEQATFSSAAQRGGLSIKQPLSAYIQHILTFVDYKRFSPLRIVVNSGNGMAGHVIDALAQQFFIYDIPIYFIRIFHNEDGHFPNGIPNPLIEENRLETKKAVLKYKADFGIAWDGDFDRCFLFDEYGQCIEGYYIVGLLAEVFLQQHPHEKIIHDPRVYWNTTDIVRRNHGIPIQSKTGHAFIKERMRKEEAIYGGEMSAHHYFRDFSYCDSGMIPWLLVVELLTKKERPLSQLVKQMIKNYPSSGEINRFIRHPEVLMQQIEKHYQAQSQHINHLDGLSMSFQDWRFNIRLSNTEPVLRLNIEARHNKTLVDRKVSELLAIIER
ncbi:phosphomannomutase/phosphoglucomutase [Psychromonas hadalis]|uniref:phosphomannomutase/phosphoglucomutase n=1 Tax=Psychromonas hadalis TaxID=211669 RepID=UPI0003B35265|nr:phosphomannomutase/phosphoglucomutase [Psychromonas hadalis]